MRFYYIVFKSRIVCLFDFARQLRLSKLFGKRQKNNKQKRFKNMELTIKVTHSGNDPVYSVFFLRFLRDVSFL